MMEQRTLNIINICKGNTKYNKEGGFVYDAIRNYIADECMFPPECFEDDDINDILWEAMEDYLDHCRKPSGFLEDIRTVMRIHDWDIYHAIAVVLGLYVRVKDNNGNYVNGFDDRLHRLDKEELQND